MLKDGTQSETLLRSLYLKTIDSNALHRVGQTWKERWFQLRSFRKGLEAIGSSSEDTCNVWRSTLGLLPLQMEKSAILYDNPQFDSGGDTSHGYFGMQALWYLPRPQNAQEW